MAIETFNFLHTERTRNYPGAMQLNFDNYDVEIESESDKLFIMKAWDVLRRITLIVDEINLAMMKLRK